MRVEGSYVSCGVRQVYELWNLNQADSGAYGPRHSGGTLASTCPSNVRRLAAMLKTVQHDSFSTFVFSDADIEENGIRLAEEIRAQFPGTQLVLASNVNPNSNNRITTWVWSPDWGLVAEWARKLLTTGGARVFTNEEVMAMDERNAPEHNGDDYEVEEEW